MCGPDIPLIINEESTLGRGGFAIVLRGKMVICIVAMYILYRLYVTTYVYMMHVAMY